MNATIPQQVHQRNLSLDLAPDAAAPRWVMLARVGTWLGHPGTPEIIGPEELKSALDYFQRHHAAHGADLVIDYHHASVLAPAAGATAPAAGWVQQMELRADGTELWGRVLWTAQAARAIGRRQFRYLSPVLRFGAPDRVTGQPVPMAIHSVALTNTPFLTELKALNHDQPNEQSAAKDGGAQLTTAQGGERMSLLENLCQALGQEPEQVASRLGLDPAAEDGAVARALVANADGAGAVSPAVARALGVSPEADETAVNTAILRLKAPEAGLEGVRQALGLPEDASRECVLNAVVELRRDRRRSEAEALVDRAVQAGKLPPAHREFYLREATRDLDAARAVINALPVRVSPGQA
ncbi:MAG: phage protease, partial [Candidatus Brocadiia bacterium]